MGLLLSCLTCFISVEIAHIIEGESRDSLRGQAKVTNPSASRGDNGWHSDAHFFRIGIKDN